MLKNVISYTDEQEVVGLCGLHKEYETAAKDSTRKMYPWMASIIVQVNGSAVTVELQRVRNDMTCATLNTANLWFLFSFFHVNVKREERIKTCLGSLVSAQFVLTAAHCFTFGDLPEHVRVEIDDGNNKSNSNHSVFLFF